MENIERATRSICQTHWHCAADGRSPGEHVPIARLAGESDEEFYCVITNCNEAISHFRHARMASVVFCDGHVAMEKMEAGSLDHNLTGQFIGRLRMEILALQ